MENKKGVSKLVWISIVIVVLFCVAVYFLLASNAVDEVLTGDVHNVLHVNDMIRAEIEKLFFGEQAIAVFLGNQMATVESDEPYGIAFGIKNLDNGTNDAGLFSYEVSVGDSDVEQKCVAEDWIARGISDKVTIAPGEFYIGLVRFIVPEAARGCNVRFHIDVTRDSVAYARDFFEVKIV